MTNMLLDVICALAVTCMINQVTAQSAVCDQGWLAYGGNCYKFNTQRYAPQRGALDDCYSNDASLLRLQSQDQLTWLLKTAKQFPSAGYWTDLNDNPKVAADRLGTGVWKWGSYEYADMSLIQWNQSPANDGQSKCAAVNIQGKLADMKCSFKQGYICKYPSSTGCDLGWLSGATACYWVSNTTDASQLRSWSDSKSICEGKRSGAKLMIISDQNDMDFLTNELPYLTKTTRTHYIGLTSTTVGTWSWYTGDTFNSALIQWQSEPDNVAGIENCGVLRMTGHFSDRDCKLYANYICFKPQYNTNPTDNLGCGNWIRAGKLCYGFMSGKMSTTWSGARSYCLNHGSDLLKLDSFDKKTWLIQQLQKQGAYWIGLNDQANEGTYVWADGSPVNNSYVNWNQEPNNYKGQEDCAVIYTTGQYNDIACTVHAAAICELDNLNPCPSGWKSNAGNCYLFTPYNNVSVLYNQIEATSYCQSFAPNSKTIGSLLSVDSQTEKTYILSQVKAMSDNIYGWYTSLNDLTSEGFWQFGNKPLLDPTLVDWHGEPSTNPGDNCAMVVYGAATHERRCDRKIPFICERYATGVSRGHGIQSSVVGCLILLLVAFLGK